MSDTRQLAFAELARKEPELRPSAQLIARGLTAWPGRPPAVELISAHTEHVARFGIVTAEAIHGARKDVGFAAQRPVQRTDRQAHLLPREHELRVRSPVIPAVRDTVVVPLFARDVQACF